MPTATVAPSTVATMPLPGMESKCSHGFDRVAVLGGVGGHGFADVMLGLVFGGGDAGDQLGFAPAGAEIDHIGDRGLAQGEGAGFVEGDGVHLAEIFQVAASFEEDAVAGGVGQTGEGGGRGGDHQGAGGGDHQQGDGAVEGVVAGLVAEIHEREEGQDRTGDDRDGVAAFEAVGEALGAALLLLRLFDDRDDAGEGALAGDAGDAHLKRAGGVDGAGVDLVADLLADRHRFAGDRGLVDGGFAFGDGAVGGDALARANEHAIADLELVDRDDGLAAVGGKEGGFLGGEVHEGAHGAAGAAEGIVFQRIGEGEEPEEDGAFFPVTDQGRADGGEHHEEIDADFAFGQELEGV